jgi:hypothetical protein
VLYASPWGAITHTIRLIAVPLAQPALQLGALQQQLIAARKLGLDRCSVGLARAGALGSLVAAHERKSIKKERGHKYIFKFRSVGISICGLMVALVRPLGQR